MGAWHDNKFLRQFFRRMEVPLPTLAPMAVYLNLPVNTTVGSYRRTWDVVRDFVVALEHLHLRASDCIGGIIPRWGARRRRYQLDRRFDWEELVMRVHNSIPSLRQSSGQEHATSCQPSSGKASAAKVSAVIGCVDISHVH